MKNQVICDKSHAIFNLLEESSKIMGGMGMMGECHAIAQLVEVWRLFSLTFWI